MSLKATMQATQSTRVLITIDAAYMQRTSSIRYSEPIKREHDTKKAATSSLPDRGFP